ncbi:MAG: phosphatase, partial [Mycobacterium sp.]|nr:phosphatase [Mycobacterium sp.]
MAIVPLNLFVSHNGKSSRQRITCRYKCGDQCAHPAPNTTENEYFGDIVAAMSRRRALKAAGVTVLAVGAGSTLAACASDESPTAASSSTPSPAAPAELEPRPGLKVAAVAPHSEDAVVIPDGYRQAVVIS